MFNTDIDNDESIFNGTNLSEADNLDLGDNEDVTGQQDEDNDTIIGEGIFNQEAISNLFDNEDDY